MLLLKIFRQFCWVPCSPWPPSPFEHRRPIWAPWSLIWTTLRNLMMASHDDETGKSGWFYYIMYTIKMCQVWKTLFHTNKQYLSKNHISFHWSKSLNICLVRKMKQLPYLLFSTQYTSGSKAGQGFHIYMSSCVKSNFGSQSLLRCIKQNKEEHYNCFLIGTLISAIWLQFCSAF